MTDDQQSAFLIAALQRLHGPNINLNANAAHSRVFPPSTPKAKLELVQRNDFEEYTTPQTMGRRGFILYPVAWKSFCATKKHDNPRRGRAGSRWGRRFCTRIATLAPRLWASDRYILSHRQHTELVITQAALRPRIFGTSIAF